MRISTQKFCKALKSAQIVEFYKTLKEKVSDFELSYPNKKKIIEFDQVEISKNPLQGQWV